MYQVKYFDPDFGTLYSVFFADNFDAGAGHVFNQIGQSTGNRVETNCAAGLFELCVLNQHNIVIASVMSADVMAAPAHAGVIDACNALQAGDSLPMAKLFAPKETFILPQDKQEIPGGYYWSKAGENSNGILPRIVWAARTTKTLWIVDFDSHQSVEIDLDADTQSEGVLIHSTLHGPIQCPTF